LNLSQALLAYLAFSALMYGAVLLRVRLTKNWRNGAISGAPPNPATV
jgi:hypothetical protein